MNFGMLAAHCCRHDIEVTDDTHEFLVRIQAATFQQVVCQDVCADIREQWRISKASRSSLKVSLHSPKPERHPTV